jgi:hypothetical protein
VLNIRTPHAVLLATYFDSDIAFSDPEVPAEERELVKQFFGTFTETYFSLYGPDPELHQLTCRMCASITDFNLGD